MSENFIQNREPIMPSAGWKATIGENKHGYFDWIIAIYDDKTITTPVYACVKGFKNQDNDITPIPFTYSGEARVILGDEIKHLAMIWLVTLLAQHQALLSTCIGDTDMLITFFSQLFGFKSNSIPPNALTYEGVSLSYQNEILTYGEWPCQHLLKM